MSGLQPAHRGYEYQDLMIAARSVDLLLGTLTAAIVDEKLVKDDRFDDLTIVDVGGCRERIQFKHTDREDQALALSAFTSDSSRQLRLDRLLACAIADRDGPGSGASSIAFRVILRDRRPTCDSIVRYLKPASPDPGPFLPGMSSYRLKFKLEEIWPDHEPQGEESDQDRSTFAFLRNAHGATRRDVAWFCERLVIEVEAPGMSGDLGIPGAAEMLLLNRSIQEIGAGQYPNAHRDPIDVGAALVNAAREARLGRIQLSAPELLRRAQLRSDFGTVAHHDPVDSALEISRPMEVADIAAIAVEMAQAAMPIVIEGPPGQGKSWTCKQLVERLESEGWLVAEHYCFLGAADNEREMRVYTESIFGTLLDLLREADPSLLDEQRPRFAASQLALEEAVRKSLERMSDRRVALIVDGLDHVSRVAPLSRASDPSRLLAEELAALVMPRGSVLIVLSQPGDHLAPLIEAGARVVQAEGFTRDETSSLIRRHGITIADTEDATTLDEIGEAIYARSQGNALYSTYLCRDLLSRGGPVGDAVATVNSLPAYDGSLEAYYQHLCESLGAEAAFVTEYLAFLDFEVTPRELAEIQPDRAHHVRSALEVLGPVLDPQAPAGSERIYHESFSRFLTDHIDEAAAKAINDRIAEWLAQKGLLKDERAYRFLIPTLARAGRHSEVTGIIDASFLMDSVAAGFPTSAILANLSVAVGSAAQINAWPIVVRCIELARGASTLEYERLDTVMIDFADVPIALIGGEEYARRLLFKRQPVMPARTGLLICAALDERGLPAPWEAYIEACIKEDARDRTSYGNASNAEVYAAVLRGQLRIMVEERVNSPEPLGRSSDNTVADWVGTPESLQSLIAYINESGLPADKAASAVLDTQGPAAALDVGLRLAEPASFALAVARQLSDAGRRDSVLFAECLNLALHTDRRPGSARILLDLGAPITEIVSGQQQERRALLLQLTEKVQEPTDFHEALATWLDHCVLASIDDPIGLAAAEAGVNGESWYRNWLRFAIHVAGAEVAEQQRRSDMALSAIKLLNLNTNPFAGKPRACDLYPASKQIRETIRRAVELLDDEAWHEALDMLAAVSDATSTTIHGELGGPFAADALLHLAVETGTTSSRREAAASLIRTTVEKGSSGRYYTDLALYRLIAARFALRTGNLKEAKSQWLAACQMLSGYGFRKDRTIFEILDPMPELIKADPRRSRNKLAEVQPLAERIPAHTDGAETRHAWSAWWRVLALADPMALANLVAPAMMARCNVPSKLHETARGDLWRSWQSAVDPVLASLLRMTLDLTLELDDRDGLERLVARQTRHRQLESQITSLADERTATYSDSNGSELPDRDATRVHEINVIADQWGAPHVTLLSSSDASAPEPPTSVHYNSSSPYPRDPAKAPPIAFPLGMPGLAHAVRAWRRRPYATTAPMWDLAKFGNAIGYRLVELIQDQRPRDAYLSLQSVAEAERFGASQGLLLVLAEGLERAGHAHLAAISHTLCWTRSRGGGGWLTFGGETGIDSLRRALELDCSATLEVIAEETQRAVDGSNLGITQAIIFAFVLAEMPAPENTTALDVAFQCWDEAATVIAARAPRVHQWDDPDEPYAPPISDDGAPYIGDLELAFALAIFAGVSNPGREQKRRSLLSLRMLLDHAPTVAGQALQKLLPVLDEPATLGWILRLVESSKYRASIVAECGPALTNLADSDYLSVRSIARRLAPAGSVANLPATLADGSLLNSVGVTGDLWFPPSRRQEAHDSNDDGLGEVLDRIAGTRIARGEAILPRFRAAVLHRLGQAVDDEQFSRRSGRQADLLGRANGVPDAYLALEEAIESALQRTASGGRVAMLANGAGVLGPQWEDQLSEAIMDDPLEPLELEATRHPRPSIPIPPGQESPDWIALTEQASGRINGSAFDHAYSMKKDQIEIVAGTKIHSSADCATVFGGCFNGWRIIGSEEQRFITLSGRQEPRRFVQRFMGLELREPGSQVGLENPALASMGSSAWALPLPTDAIPSPTAIGWPLVGYDGQMTRYGDAVHGLGIPERIMVPTDWLRMLWRLEPIAPYVLGDAQGQALALVTWRTDYQRSDYHLPWPKLRGSVIAVRPDLLHQLKSKYGEQLTLRDFIARSARVVESAA
jgi:hypothetical protein